MKVWKGKTWKNCRKRDGTALPEQKNVFNRILAAHIQHTCMCIQIVSMRRHMISIYIHTHDACLNLGIETMPSCSVKALLASMIKVLRSVRM